MKFTIHGFSQEKLLEYGLDAQDALLLRWMVDFSGSPKIRTVQQEGLTYYWIKYDAVLEDLPILTIKTAKGIGKKFLIFAEKGILVKHTERTVSGSYSCFRFTDVIDDFMRYTSKIKSHYPEKGIGAYQENSHCPKKGDAHRPKKGSHKALPQEGHCALPQEGQSNNPSTNLNPSTNNPSTTNNDAFVDKESRPKKKASITSDWLPSERCYELLAKSGITRTFADSLIEEFIFYWEECGEKRPGWNSTFMNHVKRNHEKQKSPNPATNRNSGQTSTRTQRIPQDDNFADKDYGQSTVDLSWLNRTGAN